MRLFVLDARSVIFVCIALGATVLVSIVSPEVGLFVFMGFCFLAIVIVLVFAKNRAERIRELLLNSRFVVVDIVEREIPKIKKFPMPDVMVELNGLVRGNVEQRVKLLPKTSCVYTLMKCRHVILVESPVDEKLIYFRRD